MNLVAARQKHLKNTWLRKEEKRQKVEDMFAGIWRSYFFRERLAIIKALNTGLQAAEATDPRYKTITVNIHTELTKVQKPLVPKLSKAYKTAGTTIAADTAMGAGFKFPGFPKDTADWLKKYVPKITGHITETNKKIILKIVKKGVEDGLSNKQIADQLKQYYPKFTDYRVKLIAKQEAANIGAMTEYQMFANMPVDKKKLKKIWHNAQDNEVRDLHTIEGEAKPFHAKFTNDLRFPHDPLGSAENVINCRCWLEWVIP